MYRAGDSERRAAKETEGREKAPAEGTPDDDDSNEDTDEERADTGDLDGLGQAGTSEPQQGVAEDQGGGIEGAIGGGQSGQGGG
jgi:hypothetical protein